jgi:hypothetical protein
MLPYTLSARSVKGAGSGQRIELRQGLSPFVGSYTVQVVSEPSKNQLGFWLDPSCPSDLEDVWGYFRAEPFSRTHSLLTVAVALDLGSGLARLLFEKHVQNAVLSTPNKIRDFVEPRALAAQ